MVMIRDLIILGVFAYSVGVVLVDEFLDIVIESVLKRLPR